MPDTSPQALPPTQLPGGRYPASSSTIRWVAALTVAIGAVLAILIPVVVR